MGRQNGKLIAYIEADRAAIMAERNSSGVPDMKYVNRQQMTYVEYFVQYTSTIDSNALIIRSMTIPYIVL